MPRAYRIEDIGPNPGFRSFCRKRDSFGWVAIFRGGRGGALPPSRHRLRIPVCVFLFHLALSVEIVSHRTRCGQFRVMHCPIRPPQVVISCSTTWGQKCARFSPCKKREKCGGSIRGCAVRPSLASKHVRSLSAPDGSRNCIPWYVLCAPSTILLV